VAQRAKPTTSMLFSTISGIVMFVVAQSITLALFLPIFQLGAVTGALK